MFEWKPGFRLFYFMAAYGSLSCEGLWITAPQPTAVIRCIYVFMSLHTRNVQYFNTLQQFEVILRSYNLSLCTVIVCMYLILWDDPQFSLFDKQLIG